MNAQSMNVVEVASRVEWPGQNSKRFRNTLGTFRFTLS